MSGKMPDGPTGKMPVLLGEGALPYASPHARAPAAANALAAKCRRQWRMKHLPFGAGDNRLKHRRRRRWGPWPVFFFTRGATKIGMDWRFR